MNTLPDRARQNGVARPLKVLLVEDDETDAILLKRALEKGGFAPTISRIDTGPAMEMALEQGEWDIILADHSMPQFSAPEALGILKSHGLDLPFIIVSGHIEESTAVEAMESGAHDYIMKDRLARLAPAVKRELREAEVRRAQAQSEAELLQSRQELEVRVRQRTADLELAYETLRKEVAQRRRLENELLEIAENERRRIGFDLHDDLGQKLTGLSMLVKVLENRLTTEGHPCAEEARRMSELIMETMQHTHNLARDFSDLDAEGEDLGVLLQRLSQRAGTMFGVPCECELKGTLPRFSEETARQFYKIAQEALSNAIKHGRATVVRMELSQDDAAITLRVTNDGVPFTQPTSAHGRMGLKIMSYRASIVGARFHIAGVPEGGTVVTCTLPRGALKCPELAETMQT